MISLFKPYIPKETVEEVADVLRCGWLAQGARVAEFEKEFAALFKVRNCVSLNSGTSALETAYELISLRPGDEVITTPLTCSATNIPLLRMGVKIVWADIQEHTLCIDPFDVRAKMTEKTRAVVQVHLGGVKADCGMVHVPVISDACQALGIFNGDYTCCSFQAIKHITTADGGMLVCPGGAEEHNAKLMRWFGIDRDRKIDNGWEAYRTRMMCFDIKIPGYKRQMNDLAAVMGLVGLRNYSRILEHRGKIFRIYRDRLSDLDGIQLVDGIENVYWLATVLVNRRDDFARMLFKADIDCNVVQVRNDSYEIFGGKCADLPVLDSVEDRYVSIPIGMHVSEDDANYICDKIEGGW